MSIGQGIDTLKKNLADAKKEIQNYQKDDKYLIFKYLNDKFIMAFEIGYKQGKDITKIVNKYYKDINMSVEKDYSGRDRFVFIWNH